MSGQNVLAVFIWLIILQYDPAGAASWQMMIKPAVGHIKPNGSITVMCRANTRLTDCQFKVGNSATKAIDMDFSEGKHSMAVIPESDGKTLFEARYTGTGLEHGQCGVTLDRVLEGLYTIGCRAQADFGSRRQDFMSLAVDDLKPFKLQSKPRYKVVEPGSDVHLLCFTPNHKPLTQCSFKLPKHGWVILHKGHNSKETAQYQYSGRGLEKGECGVKLTNVTAADSGVIWCNGVSRGGGQQYRAITLRVAASRPLLALTVANVQLAIGDRLEARCTVHGVYPLPSVAWHVGDELLRQDDVDDTPHSKAGHRWLWDMQTVTQELRTRIKADVAKKELKCSVVMEKPPPNAAVKLGDVKPNCGYRMKATYDNDYKHKIAKREILERPQTPKRRQNFGGGTRKPCLGHDCSNASAPTNAGNLDDLYEEESKFYNLEGDYEDFDPDVRIGGGKVVITPAKPKVPTHLAGGEVVVPGGGEVVSEGNTTFESFPWHAGLYRSLGKPGTYTLDCGGTLISDKHIVTAAHCVWDETSIRAKPASIYKVALGKLYSAWPRQDGRVLRRDLAAIHVHPSYRGRRNNFQHDVAVLEMGEAVAMSARVNVACVDWTGEFVDEQLKTGSMGTVTGWGYTEHEEISEVLRYVRLPYMEPGACFMKIDDDMKRMMAADKFCAGFSDRDTSVCPGDSGGGLVFRHDRFGAHYLRGIVSVSFRPPGYLGKCFMSEVTGFTDLGHSLKWIANVTGIDA